jgi:hypothetical protein
VQLLQLVFLVLGLEFLLVMVWTFFLLRYLWREVCYLDWLLVLGFSSKIILFVKVKVLRGGFGLWLGDNIAILSMVKQAHLLF